MSRIAYSARLEDMRRAEFGSRTEVAVRYLVMALVVVLLTFVIDLWLALTWAAAYVTGEAGTAAAVHLTRLGTPRFRYHLALGFYVFCGIVFLGLPLYLISAGISPALNYVAAAGLVGWPLYTLQRTQKDQSLLTADCGLVVTMSAVLLAVMYGKLDGWADRLTVLFITLAVVGYYLGSVYSGWRHQVDLRQTQHKYAMAQKSRALAQFSGGVAHDFNNQLTTILGNLELHDQLDTPEDRKAALQSCRLAAEQAALTVQQLLATSGRTRLSPRPVEMEPFLYEFGDLLTDLLEPGMVVEVVPPEEPLTARVDRDMLETSAIQLCLNAQDATGGQGIIRLRVERRAMAPGSERRPDTPPPYVVLIIEDNGPGVPQEALPLLAEPFYTTKPPHEGKGLGLSAVSGFARQSGGLLLIEAALGGGLKTMLYLPASAPPVVPAQAHPAGAPQLSGS